MSLIVASLVKILKTFEEFPCLYCLLVHAYYEEHLSIGFSYPLLDMDQMSE